METIGNIQMSPAFNRGLGYDIKPMFKFDICLTSQILHYMHQFQIVILVNDWVARLLCLPPTFRFVRLGV